MESLLNRAIRAAQEAGLAILPYYQSADFNVKEDGSPVTIADTVSNDILVSHLQETGIPILSEEMKGLNPPYPSRIWIIDPLDGTKDFLNKTNDFSVMVGLLQDGAPVLGVVFAPIHKTLYYAMQGAGAFVVRNDVAQRLQVSSREIDGLRFVRSVHHFNKDLGRVGEMLSSTLHPRGSIGIKAGCLGEDVGDFFCSFGNLGEWDTCAPQIITTEAGGMVSDVDGNPLIYGNPDNRMQRGIVFSNSACHKHVVRAMQAVSTS